MKVKKLFLLFNGKGNNGLRYKGKSEALNNVSLFSNPEATDGICYGIILVTLKFYV